MLKQECCLREYRISEQRLRKFRSLLSDNSGEDQMNFVTKIGPELLDTAVRLDQPQLVRMVLDLGVDVNAQDSWGWTSLHVAVFRDKLSVIELLSAAEASTTVQGKSGRIPLQYAMRNHSPYRREIIGALVAAGANLSLRDNEGKTALDIAFEERNQELAQILFDMWLAKNVGRLPSQVKPDNLSFDDMYTVYKNYR